MHSGQGAALIMSVGEAGHSVPTYPPGKRKQRLPLPRLLPAVGLLVPSPPPIAHRPRRASNSGGGGGKGRGRGASCPTRGEAPGGGAGGLEDVGVGPALQLGQELNGHLGMREGGGGVISHQSPPSVMIRSSRVGGWTLRTLLADPRASRIGRMRMGREKKSVAAMPVRPRTKRPSEGGKLARMLSCCLFVCLERL